MRSDFGRTIDLDLSSRDGEIAEEMFPLDIVLDSGDRRAWERAYLHSGPGEQSDRWAKWERFEDAVTIPFEQYQVPAIDLAKSTPKEAVCQVFEKVNTGGVTLTVFELLTATYAAGDFELREGLGRAARATLATSTAGGGRRHGVRPGRHAAGHLRAAAVTRAGPSGGRQAARRVLQASRGTAASPRRLPGMGRCGGARASTRGTLPSQ